MEGYSLVDSAKQIRRVLWYTFAANEAVAVIKLVWGYLSGSLGMVSDGFHSMFDGVTNIMGLVGIWIASHPPDSEHPYGHRKFETVFTFVVSGMIFLTCYEVLRGVWHSMHDGTSVEVSPESFIIMGLTISVNFAVMRYEMHMSRKLKSDFLRADALHTRSNLYSSAGVIGGLSLAYLGFPMADTLAGLLVAGFIAHIGFDILKRATDVLVDTVCIDIKAVEKFVMSIDGVRECHKVRARGPAEYVNVDLHVKLDGSISLKDAHYITHDVQNRIKEAFPQIKDIVVHTEPC
jgi:cation diffusion facilitator family transporter